MSEEGNEAGEEKEEFHGGKIGVLGEYTRGGDRAIKLGNDEVWKPQIAQIYTDFFGVSARCDVEDSVSFFLSLIALKGR